MHPGLWAAIAAALDCYALSSALFAYATAVLVTSIRVQRAESGSVSGIQLFRDMAIFAGVAVASLTTFISDRPVTTPGKLFTGVIGFSPCILLFVYWLFLLTHGGCSFERDPWFRPRRPRRPRERRVRREERTLRGATGEASNLKGAQKALAITPIVFASYYVRWAGRHCAHAIG